MPDPPVILGATRRRCAPGTILQTFSPAAGTSRDQDLRVPTHVSSAVRVSTTLQPSTGFRILIFQQTSSFEERIEDGMPAISLPPYYGVKWHFSDL